MSEKTAIVAAPKDTTIADSEKSTPIATTQVTIPTDNEEVREELEHRVKLLQIYKSNLRMLEERAAKFGPAYAPPEIIYNIEETKQNIAKLEKDIASLQKAEVAIEKGKPIPVPEEGKDLLFMPEWSVLRSKIQYVDASL